MNAMLDATNLLFDFDGTIVDSAPGILNAYAYAAQTFGIAIDLRVVESYIGPPIARVARETLGLSDADALRFISFFREYYREKGNRECGVYPGVERALRQLQDDGRANYICTSKLASVAQTMIEQLGLSGYFRDIFGATDSRCEKIDVLSDLLGFHAIPPKSAAMIGDRASDLLAGKACKTKSVGVLYGYGTRAELEACEADALAATADELSALFLGA